MTTCSDGVVLASYAAPRGATREEELARDRLRRDVSKDPLKNPKRKV
jgi:hypothetical protein